MIDRRRKLSPDEIAELAADPAVMSWNRRRRLPSRKLQGSAPT
jgi:hypothetical protein